MEGLRNNKLAEDLLHLALAQGASSLHMSLTDRECVCASVLMACCNSCACCRIHSKVRC